MKFVKGILAAVLLLCSYSASAYEWDFYDVNEYGDTIYYEITSSTELTCEVANKYKEIDGRKTSYGNNSYSGDIVIPETVTYNEETYSVTSIGQWAFLSCESLTSVTIPNSIIEIGSRAFERCTSLTSITIPNSVTTIYSYAFNECTRLNTIVIGSGVTIIDAGAFWDCSSLTSITSLNPEPPKCYNGSLNGVIYNIFYDVPISCKLYVPEGSLEAYANADPWMNFINIETTGIASTTVDTQVKELYRYTIDGKRIDAPQKGINIIKYSDGTTKKVLVK